MTQNQNQNTDFSNSDSKLVQSLINAFQADRRAERKRHYVKYGLVAGVVFAYLFTLGLGVSQMVGPSEASKDEPYAALVRVTGEIMPGKSASAEVVNPLLEKAFADKQAKGVVVQINSPGGTPVQSALIHDRINLLKAKYNKKVVMVGEDMMASGAYLIASAGDEIVVNRSTVAGSIGVISAGFGFTGVMEKLGVERRVMTAGESKNLLDPFSPQTEHGRETQAQLLSQIHEHFKDVVKQGRGDRLKADTPGLFSGTVWTGSDAVKYGLADKLGDTRSAVQENFGVEKVREYAAEKPLLQSLIGGLGVAIGTGIGNAVSSNVAPSVQAPLLKQ